MDTAEKIKNLPTFKYSQNLNFPSSKSDETYTKLDFNLEKNKFHYLIDVELWKKKDYSGDLSFKLTDSGKEKIEEVFNYLILR